MDPLFHKMSAQFDEGGASGACCAPRRCVDGSTRLRRVLVLFCGGLAGFETADCAFNPYVGLLLNNLSVYSGCQIIFDSSDVPEQALSAAGQGPADVQACSASCCSCVYVNWSHCLAHLKARVGA